MPKLTPTLWIFNAVTLPIVGLVIALTPKAPIATNDSSSQPVVAPDAKPSLKKPDQAKELLLPSSAKEPVSAPSVQPLALDIKPLPKKIKSTLARPAQPIASVTTSPPITSKQVIAASSTFSSPTKSQPAFRLSSQDLISLRPPERVVATPPFAAPEAESSL